MPDEDSVVVTVADTGRGIPPEFLPHIFDRFSQADSSITRQHRGLGLGLGIVRHLVELHHGTVEAESKGVGRARPSASACRGSPRTLPRATPRAC